MPAVDTVGTLMTADVAITPPRIVGEEREKPMEASQGDAAAAAMI